MTSPTATQPYILLGSLALGILKFNQNIQYKCHECENGCRSNRNNSGMYQNREDQAFNVLLVYIT